MGKQRKGGLLYLQTTIRIDWSSGRELEPMEQEKLMADVMAYLEEIGCRNQDESSSNSVLNFITPHAGFGLQACVDLVKTEKSPIVFLDSICPRPSAISNALGLYFSNYFDTAKVYCLQGVEASLRSKLNLNTNAFVLRTCSDELRKRIEASLNPVRVQKGRNLEQYTPVSLTKSMGKAHKAKK